MLHQTGSGVLGPVFRAFHPQDDRIVAVKAFALDLLPEDVVRLADALRRLASSPSLHPAIVPVVDAGLEGTRPFIVMPCQAGETLDVRLRQAGPSGLEEALPWLATLAAALDSAAAVGVAHGALHPRDVFVAPDGSLTLTGVGIVQALESAGVRAPIRRPYAAPERAGAGWDTRADIYSLGAIAHELFTRRRPVGPGEQDGEFASGLPAHQRVQLRRVLARALEERPDQRYGTAAAFVAALDAIARRERVTFAHPVIAEAPVVVAPPVAVEMVAEEATPADARESHAPAMPAPPPPSVVEPDIAAGVAEATVSEPEPLEDVVDAAADVAVIPEAARTPDHVDVDEPVSSSPVAAWSLGDEPLAVEPPRAAITPIPVMPALASRRRAGRGFPWAAVAALVVAAVGVGGLTVYLIRGAWNSSIAEPARVQAPLEGRDITLAADAPRAAVTPPPEPAPPVEPVEEADEPAPPAAADAQRVALPSGRLVVRSEPSGALVMVDGRMAGETPVTIRDLSLGQHSVQVARSGYIPRTERVTLRPASPARTLSFSLAPGLAPSEVTRPAPRQVSLGSIDVDSRPRGARVLVDGRYLGQAPLRVSELTAGAYAITLEMGGYQTATRQVDVEAGKSSAVRVTLASTPQVR